MTPDEKAAARKWLPICRRHQERTRPDDEKTDR